LTVAQSGTPVGTRGTINLIAGDGATITAVDNPAADRVDVTFVGTGGGEGSGGTDTTARAAAATAQAAANAAQATANAAVPLALYDANSLLVATADNTPLALPMAASTMLARLATGGIKAATPGEILTLLGIASAGAFDPLTQINPLHYWIASGTSQSGGLVDSLLDVGRTPKNFTQTGAARAPTAVDGGGKTYLAPDGAADFYTAGVAADWQFLNDGTPWTLCMIYHRTAAPTAAEMVLDDANGSTGSVGMSLQFSTGGPTAYIFCGTGGQYVQVCESEILNTNLSVLVVRHTGDNGVLSNAGITSRPEDMTMRRNGVTVASSARNTGVGYSGTTPTNTLTLFRRAATADRFAGHRLYELLITDSAISDRCRTGYEAYALATYGVAT
jgi:hypothetical protein